MYPQRIPVMLTLLYAMFCRVIRLSHQLKPLRLWVHLIDAACDDYNAMTSESPTL